MVREWAVQFDLARASVLGFPMVTRDVGEVGRFSNSFDEFSTPPHSVELTRTSSFPSIKLETDLFFYESSSVWLLISSAIGIRGGEQLT